MGLGRSGHSGKHLCAWQARIHPDDLARVEIDRLAHFAGESPSYANERRMQARGGRWEWILSRCMVVSRDTQGRPLRMIGAHSEICNRRKGGALHLAWASINQASKCSKRWARPAISLSIAVAFFSEHGANECLLLQSADAALCQAKNNGRNQL